MTDLLRSPRLDALLDRARRGLVRGVWLHGIGTALLVASLWLLFAALADYTLHLPLGIRVIHGLVALAAPLWILYREWLRPLRGVPDREGVALLFERLEPGGEDLFISALQLPRQDLGTEAGDRSTRPLVERVVRRAEERAARTRAGSVLDPRGPRRRASLGVLTLALGLGLAAGHPELSRIFFARLAGSSTPWPQRTHLVVEVPATSPGIEVQSSPDLLTVRVARGSDLPVLVRAEGLIPREVFLHFADGSSISLPTGGVRLFRTRLRSIQADTSFHVSGGDDPEGRPRVEVIVLEPPDVAGVAWSVTPPTYSGLEPSVVHAPDVEVLAGSQVRVHLLPDPPTARGEARLLPEDRVIPLEPAPFPGPPSGEASEGESQAGLAFDLKADVSSRVSFQLQDDTGLSNPDPGLYALTVLEDRRPELFLLAPGRVDADVVSGGAVPLRVRAQDDFGLGGIHWEIRSNGNGSTGDGEPILSEGDLEVHPPEAGRENPSGAHVGVAAKLLEVDELGGDSKVREGMQFELQVRATDRREPVPGETLSSPIRLRVVSGDQFLRNLQEHLTRAGESARRLYQLAEKRERLHRDLLSAAGGDEGGLALGDLASMQSGLRQVQGDARALARDLAYLTEELLYSRLDERASALLSAVDAELSQNFDQSFQPAPWRLLARRYHEGLYGKADLAGILVEILGLSLEVSEEHLAAAADALREAAEATDPAQARKALERVLEAQARARETLDELLVKLGEWDNFQSVLALTRDILNRQKALIERTRELAEKEENR